MTLRNAAQMVVGEHVRARRALVNLYPIWRPDMLSPFARRVLTL